MALVATLATLLLATLASGEELPGFTDAGDKAALLAFWDTCGGSNGTGFVDVTGWTPPGWGNASSDPCTFEWQWHDNPKYRRTGWDDIECNDAGRVTSIKLIQYSIKCELPDALGHLTELNQFNLGNNMLSGSVPEWLAGMPKLTGLALQDNQFSGCVPKCIGLCADTLDSDGCFITYSGNPEVTGHCSDDCVGTYTLAPVVAPTASPTPDSGDTDDSRDTDSRFTCLCAEGTALAAKTVLADYDSKTCGVVLGELYDGDFCDGAKCTSCEALKTAVAVAEAGGQVQLCCAAAATPTSPTSPPVNAPTTTADSVGPAQAVRNPSFEQETGPSFWKAGDGSGLSRQASEFFAPMNGEAYASLEAGSSALQVLGEIESGKAYSVTLWTRSLNAIIPEVEAGEQRGVQRTYPKVLSKAKLALKVGGGEVASAEITVSTNESVIANDGVNAQDDGANIWLADGWRIHMGNTLLYQKATADPIGDSEWTEGNENGGTWGMAVGPVTALNGSLVIAAVGGAFTTGDAPAGEPGSIPDGEQATSRIELAALVGAAPNYSGPERVGTDFVGPIYNTVLKHIGDEAPWVFDAHYCYDDDTGRLYMTWGGHSGFLTEVDPVTGMVIDPATGEQPDSLLFNNHAEGVHTKILTNKKWQGTQLESDGAKVDYFSKSEAPEGWEGDDFSSQKYMEGLAMFKHGGYFFACGTYGSMGDSYTIRCCRQAASEPTAPRGPFTDKQGDICSEFSTKRNKYPASMLLGPDGDHLVPGHPHFWKEGEKFYLGYDFRTQVPSIKEDSMAIRRLYFDETGWPTVWMPLTVTIDAAAAEGLVGQALTVELTAGGDAGSVVGFDQVVLSVVDSPADAPTPTAATTASPAVATDAPELANEDVSGASSQLCSRVLALIFGLLLVGSSFGHYY